MSDKNKRNEEQANKTSELLPCPFCGEKLDKWTFQENFYEHPYNGCILSGKKVLNSEHDIKAWNTRKPMQEIVERLKEEKETHTEHYNISLYKDFPDVKRRYEQMLLVINKAIEIVKEVGGMNDN